MERLTPVNRELIVAYYEEGNQMNADRRRELAERMGLEPNALWVRVHRIRDRLRGCVGECFKNK
jgi:DNA-directed RNA polymerase specialized sigma24 family protein